MVSVPAWARGLRTAAWGNRLGLSVSATTVHALVLDRGTPAWVGAADYSSLEDLAEVIARLAGECERAPRRARIVLTRELVQIRALVPPPPLKRGATAQYVALEAPRLFRKNGHRLVTDGTVIVVSADQRALWAAAVEEPIVQAVLSGCAQAGLEVEAIGPATDVMSAVLPSSSPSDFVFPNTGTSERISVGAAGAWRSRLVRHAESPSVVGTPPLSVPQLESLGERAPAYAAAYGAAVRLPRLSLLPLDTRAARVLRARRRLLRLAMVALLVWVAAGITFVTKLALQAETAARELARLAPALDSAVGRTRELATAKATLAQMTEAERSRSRHLEMLAAITGAIGDSVALVSLRIGDTTVRLAGYAPIAIGALAALGDRGELGQPRLDGPITRETRAGTSWDRFAAVARLELR